MSLRAWIDPLRVLFRPTPSTFEDLAKDCERKLPPLFLWFLVSLSAGCIAGSRALWTSPEFTGILMTIIIVPLGIILWAISVQWIAGWIFRRKKDRRLELACALGWVSIAGFLANSLVSLIPGIGSILAHAANVYFLALAAIAVHAITKLKVWESAAAAILGAVIGLVATLCALVFGFSLLRTTSGMFLP